MKGRCFLWTNLKVAALAMLAPMLLTRNLLYTAVTRAKKMVVLIGTKQCVARMVNNNYTKIRYTMLKHFLDQDGEKK